MVSVILVVLMVLSLAITCVPFASASDQGYMESGIANAPKLTREEIAKALTDTAFDTPVSPWTVAPTYNGYKAGTINKSVAQKGVDRLNALRAIAGLTPVTLNDQMSGGAQQGALLMSTAGVIMDTPQRPADMTEERYEELLPYAQSCVYATTSSLCDAIDGWMSGKNDATLSARRQQLSPSMPWVGYGYVKNPSTSWWLYKDFWAAAMTSGSSARPKYEFIGWPASGYFPTDLFPVDTFWSVSLNPEEYKSPDYSQVQVLLTRDIDGVSWILCNNTGDCNVTGNTIMFRPDDIAKYTGSYTVTVSGIERTTGESAVVRYRVQFFDVASFITKPIVTPSPAPEETPGLPPRDPNKDPALPPTDTTTRPMPKPITIYGQQDPVEFIDIDSTHWAYDYVQRAAQCGVMLGVGNNKFAPGDSVTGYEFATILLRLLYREEFDKVADTNPWTVKVDAVAATCGLWDGLSAMQRSQPITRNQMATMIANAIRDTRLPKVKDASVASIAGMFTDWEDIPVGYRNDVAACIYNQVLTGVGDNRFGGTQNMNRAQAATVFCRLYDLAPKM